MDEIEFKLKSNNPILITHGISRILEKTKQKIVNEKNREKSKITELNSLFSNCKSENSVVSSVACQAIVALVENNLLEISPTLSKLISILGETKNYSAITSAICNLLIQDLKIQNLTDEFSCPYSIQAPQHPLITVLTQKIETWRDILAQMQSILHHSKPELIRHHIELLRPVFIYILCNPSLSFPESCRNQTWHLLIKTNDALDLQLEVLQWLRVNDADSCINTSNLILQLAESTIDRKDKKLSEALAPLVMALALDLLKQNCDPRSNIDTIESILKLTDGFSGSVTLALLAEMLLITPTIYLLDIMKIGFLIIQTVNCSKIMCYSLVASILPWMAYANLLSSDALDIGKELIDMIIVKSFKNYEPQNPHVNPYFNILFNVNENLQFYTELTVSLDSQTDDNLIDWLDRLSAVSNKFLYNYRLILGGIFLSTKNSTITLKAAKLLLNISKYRTNFAGYVLSLFLYKLSKINDANETKELFFMFPELAISKENVPIIVQTLETMINSGDPLKYFAINLYLKAWMIEPRCHRYLFQALIDMCRNDKTMKGNTTCAKAMKFICEHRPEHGAELVPLLSQILNHCPDTSGSAACALALHGISALCLSGVADVCSTWKVLAPKMNKEERAIVIRSMCDFFGDIPANTAHPEEEFEQLLDEVLTKLWQFSLFETTKNIDVVKAAFKALSAYTINQMKLSVLPEQFRNNLQLPQKYAQKLETEIKEKPEDSLAYIPGICWINMLETIHENSRTYAGNLIIKFISDELYTYRSGIYMWPMGEPINYKYLPEKSPARAIGEYIRRYNYNCHPNKEKILLECLRIFAHKYLKPLPPVKWSLLNEIITVNDDTWKYGSSLACHQVAISPSAKEFLSKYITEMTNKCHSIETVDEFKECWHLCIHLEDLCRGIMSNVLGPFLDATINFIVDKAIVDKDNTVDMFNQLMEYYFKSLTDDLVHHDNKSLLIDILEGLFNKIDVDNKIFTSLIKPMMGISSEKIERLTLPSVWKEITIVQLKKAILLRAGLVLKKDNEMPLSWMNEIIRVSSKISGVHKYLLENMIRIQSQLRDEKSNAAWSWDLMCQIQAVIVNSSERCSLDSTKFLCDVFFITVIIFSCGDCLVSNDETIITSFDVRARLFPHALGQLVSMSHWKDMTQQIMEWLHIMRTSSLPLAYRIVFYSALVSLKRERYLNDLWIKYFSTKSPINL